MADNQPSEISIAVATPIKDSSLARRGGGEGGGGGGGGGGEAGGEQVKDTVGDEGSATVHEYGDAPRAGHDVSMANDQTATTRAHDAAAAHASVMPSSSAHPPNDASDDASGISRGTSQLQTPPLTAHSSPDPGQSTTTSTTQPQPQHPQPPLKRFTSVNINKKFLEKTSSTSGTSLGGSPLTGHASGGASAGGSGQGRGASPSSRSPSNDRPAPSRLVTAKLTAVPQPSTASTSGWLRTNSSTPGSSAAPTPPSSSPQPPPNGPPALSTPSSGPQPLKRRPGESPSQNGVSSAPSTLQQTGSKQVWGKVPPPAPNTALGHSKDSDKLMQNDFPTAAEAAHGRKTKILNAQLAAESAAAQTAAQKQAMNETAAAFRGVHLDPNAHHWDEMEDEDSDFLAGVIEFGDGTQYKIENKADATPPQDAQPTSEALGLQSLRSPPIALQSHPAVTKEERFGGDDFDRSWPRARTSPVQVTPSHSFPPRGIPLQHTGVRHSPTDGPAAATAQSPQDGTSPTSRVLFNERSNRLEPWSNARPRPGPGPGPGPDPMLRREDHPSFSPSRQSRDAPPHSYPSPTNVQLLQKGPPDSAWKGGPPRGFGHGPERGRWGAPPPRDEERSWEARRRESMSSSEAQGSSARDPSRDRGSRWDTAGVSQGRDADIDGGRGRRNSNIGMPPPPVLPSSLARDRSRDAGRQLPPHLSRMPPPPVPPLRGAPARDLPPHAIATNARPHARSPSTSGRSLLSPSSEQASISPVLGAPAGAEDEVDKDTLVKGAMQLAIDRAKRRKQEGEAEEKRRLEGAERAKKKAEALAAALEEKKSAQAQASLPAQEQRKVIEKPPIQQDPHLPPKPNGVEVPHKPREALEPEVKAGTVSPNTVFGRPPVPPRAVNPPPILPRRPSVPPPPTLLTAASRSESWRSKAAPVPSSPPRPARSPPPAPPSRRPLPPTTNVPELDLSVQPDENIEIVDFSDLGKLMGRSSTPEPPSTIPEPASASSPVRARRPVASDFFDELPTSSREPLSPVKSDTLSWRRSLSKPTVISPPATTGEELGTQTMPIFTADEPHPVKESPGLASESKSSPTITASPPLKRQLSQGDQVSPITTGSVYVPPAVMALRSPRTQSHFKEAPMSTLTDTMSRIKGALAGMQTQDTPSPAQTRDLKENLLEHRSPPASTPGKARPTEASTASSWREPRDSRSDQLPQVTRILAPPPSRPVTREVFDVTRSDPPRSPKPAWNAFNVRLPKESHPRDAISRKQLHFWNLPHPGVRWDILSWVPPVEGMNKRELSRDEIFHRKNAIKGGKLRVLLPSKRLHPRVIELASRQESSSPSSQPALVTAAGVKIKLPSAVSSSRQNSVEPAHTVPLEKPRDTNVPSWRKSAMPLTPAKKVQQIVASVNGSPDGQLNTISRSPPPEPSTPLPQFVKPKSGTPSSPASPQSATVSLPTNSPSYAKSPAPKRPAGPDVAFFRTSRGEPDADKRKPLPRFTVTSELDNGEPPWAPSTANQAVNGIFAEPAQTVISSSRGSPRNVPSAETPLPSLVASKPESKSSDDSGPGTQPVTPPSTHTSSAWGKSPLSFSVKESPARSAPDPEHLKAVWSQPSGRAATTSNSLKGIADDLPSIPFTVQDMKSEDGETPPPTAPAPPPSRLSLQEVTRAFQQVPSAPAPATSSASRPPSYAQTPFLSSGSMQTQRLNQPTAISLPQPQHIRPAFAPYPHSIVGHSPSPTLMYAPGVPSPVAHHRMAINGPSPPVAHAMWLPTPPPPPSQPGSFMRAGNAPQPAQMMYPSPSASSSAPGQMMHRRMSVVSPGGVPPGPSMYAGHPMDMQGHMHHAHAHPIGHPVPHMHVGHIFSPPQPGHTPAMYAVPVGAGRGTMMHRPGFESMPPQLPPHNPGYNQVPPTSFVHPFHS